MLLMRLFAAAVLLASAASAQGRLVFDAESLDVGRIAEADGPVTRTFGFVNGGDQPLRLAAVEAACGCTTPAWTEAPVAPGGRGEVVVTYDPAGRPGDFEKSVFVRAEGAVPEAVTLRLEGVVRPELADAGERIGSLGFAARTVDVGTIRAGEPLQTSFRFANAGTRPVRIDSVVAPAGVDVVRPQRPTFPDGLAGLFVSAADPAALAEGGVVRIALVLLTTDLDAPVKRLEIVGRVEE